MIMIMHGELERIVAYFKWWAKNLPGVTGENQ
jgi:hypothetical protein